MKKAPRITTEEKRKIALLIAQGLTPNAVGNHLQRDAKTVRLALSKADVQESVGEYQERLAEKFEKLTDRILDAVSEEDVAKASLQQKVIAAATSIDKTRLLRGQSTVNLAAIYSQALELRGQSDKEEE